MDSCYVIHPTHILAISTQQGKGEIWDLLEESKHVKPYNTHNNEPMTKKNIMDEARNTSAFCMSINSYAYTINK